MNQYHENIDNIKIMIGNKKTRMGGKYWSMLMAIYLSYEGEHHGSMADLRKAAALHMCTLCASTVAKTAIVRYMFSKCLFIIKDLAIDKGMVIFDKFIVFNFCQIIFVFNWTYCVNLLTMRNHHGQEPEHINRHVISHQNKTLVRSSLLNIFWRIC